MSYLGNCARCRGRGTVPLWDREQNREKCSVCGGTGCK